MASRGPWIARAAGRTNLCLVESGLINSGSASWCDAPCPWVGRQARRWACPLPPGTDRGNSRCRRDRTSSPHTAPCYQNHSPAFPRYSSYNNRRLMPASTLQQRPTPLTPWRVQPTSKPVSSSSLWLSPPIIEVGWLEPLRHRLGKIAMEFSSSPLKGSKNALFVSHCRMIIIL
jgi:hypothetical protein